MLHIEPELVTRAILGALNWTVRWFRPEGTRSAVEVASHLADYLVRGLTLAPELGSSRPSSAEGADS